MSSLQEILNGWLDGTTAPPPVTKLVGISLLEGKDGVARLELITGPQHYNPMGIVHGGILCDLADAAMGVAMASSLHEGETFGTIELHAHFLRSVQKSRLTATGRIFQRGGRVGYAQCEIHDEHGDLVATAASTCLIQSVDNKT